MGTPYSICRAESAFQRDILGEFMNIDDKAVTIGYNFVNRQSSNSYGGMYPAFDDSDLVSI